MWMYRITGPDPGPEPLREILARLFTTRGWGRRQARLHLEKAWADAVGPKHADKTRVLGLKHGILEVEVNSAILLQELAQYHKRKLLARMRERLPNHTFTDVRFRAGTWEVG
jgi:predicted nucleic acid-binding Zn ribbon protein